MHSSSDDLFHQVQRSDTIRILKQSQQLHTPQAFKSTPDLTCKGTATTPDLPQPQPPTVPHSCGMTHPVPKTQGTYGT